MLAISSYYAQLSYREPEPEQMAAGFDRLQQFGFFGTLTSKAKNEGRSRKEILKIPAIVFYMEQVYEAQLGDCLKELEEIRKSKQTV